MQRNNPKPKNKDGKIRFTFITATLIVLLGFAVYGNSLNGEFVFDDEGLVKHNICITSWSNASRIFSEDIGAEAVDKSNFYRPLQILTFMIDYSIWGLNVKGYHLTNILLHILVALSIFQFITILYDDRPLSLLTSVFFIVHPIHTEAVTYISGRADPLALLFMLVCFIFYIKHFYLKNKGVYILMILSYILALLSKETSLILPVLLLLYHYTFKKRIKIELFLPILSVTFIYILLRAAVLKSALLYTSSTTTLFQRIPGFFVALTNYSKLLFLPFNLHMEYGNRLFFFSNPKTILGIFLLSSLLIFAFRKRNSNSLIFFSISWFFLTLLPVSNIYLPINAYMAEHWLYLPSIGFFLILARLLCYMYRVTGLRILTSVFIISLLTFYSSLTIRQNIYWRGPITFYERTLKYTPDSPRIYNNLGLAYRYIGKNEKAIAMFRKAIEIDPNYAKPYYNLDVLYSDINLDKEAITLFQKAMAIGPNSTSGYYNNLGAVYYSMRKIEEAIDSFRKAIEIDPNYAKAYYNLGVLYSDINLDKEALTLFRKAIEIDPNYAKAYNKLSAVYFRRKQYKLAIEYCDRAAELDFVDPVLLEGLKRYRKK